MSPALISFIALSGLYFLGRLFERHPQQHGRMLTPSRVEHFDEYDTSDDEGIDCWAEVWEASFADDDLEAVWNLPARSHA